MAGLILLTTLSCGKYDFVNQMQGKWEVNQISYESEDTTIINSNPNMFFQFENTNYTSLLGDSIIEAGTYNVNPKVTQIGFYSDLGNNIFIIEENSEQSQTWRSKKKFVDFYLRFKLIKLN